MSITYAEAVNTLLDYAINQDGSGAKAAAQVLLSTYNSYNYHIALTDLGNIDQTGYIAAITVIRCRIEQRTEPHEVIDNGDELFTKLENKWRPLQTQFRHADKYIDRDIIWWKCPHCGSTKKDYEEGPFPGRIDGKPRCDSWSDEHPEDETPIMEPSQ